MRRYVCVEDGMLRMFQDETDSAPVVEQSLQGATVLRSTRQPRREFEFDLYLNNGSSLIRLLAENEEQRSEWMRRIAAAALHGASSTRSRSRDNIFPASMTTPGSAKSTVASDAAARSPVTATVPETPTTQASDAESSLPTPNAVAMRSATADDAHDHAGGDAPDALMALQEPASAPATHVMVSTTCSGYLNGMDPVAGVLTWCWLATHSRDVACVNKMQSRSTAASLGTHGNATGRACRTASSPFTPRAQSAA